MLIGERIRQLRAQKGYSQGELEKVSGLQRCYISRVEHGHTVPSLETLEKFAIALDIPLYRLFYEGEQPPPTPNLTPRRSLEELAEENGPEARFFLKIRKLLGRMTEPERVFMLDVAKKLAVR